MWHTLHPLDPLSRRNTSWSVGVSMPEKEITQVADRSNDECSSCSKLLAGIGAAMIIWSLSWPSGFPRDHRPDSGAGAGVCVSAAATSTTPGCQDRRRDRSAGQRIYKMADDLQTYSRISQLTTAEKERFASELRVAHDIQMSFLKRSFPPSRTATIFHFTRPSRRHGKSAATFTTSSLDATRLFFYSVTSPIRAFRPRCYGHDHDAHETRRASNRASLPPGYLRR